MFLGISIIATSADIGAKMAEDKIHIDPEVRAVIDLYSDILSEELYATPVYRQLEIQAQRLLEAHREGNAAVRFQISSWHPMLVGKSEEEIMKSTVDFQDAKMTIAREHGFKDWSEVLALGEKGSDLKFEKAVDAMLSGDVDRLKAMVNESPYLVHAVSRYGHGASLLHYSGTNGVESYRQIVPPNLAESVRFLIDAGADTGREANIYGGSTPIELFESSKHSHESGIFESVLRILQGNGN